MVYTNNFPKSEVPCCPCASLPALTPARLAVKSRGQRPAGGAQALGAGVGCQEGEHSAGRGRGEKMLNSDARSRNVIENNRNCDIMSDYSTDILGDLEPFLRGNAPFGVTKLPLRCGSAANPRQWRSPAPQRRLDSLRLCGGREVFDLHFAEPDFGALGLQENASAR